MNKFSTNSIALSHNRERGVVRDGRIRMLKEQITPKSQIVLSEVFPAFFPGFRKKSIEIAMKLICFERCVMPSQFSMRNFLVIYRTKDR
jgi:hypothetical protein